MKIQSLLLTLSSLSLASFCHAEWSPLVSDDFDTYSFGDQPGTTSQGITWDNTNTASKNTANQLVTNQTGGTAPNGATLAPNTAGSGNGLYYFDDDGGVSRNGINLSATADSYDVVQVSFDFSFASVTASTSSLGNITITNPDNSAIGSPDNRAVTVGATYDGRLIWTGGNFTVSSPTSSHSMSIVANGGDSSYTYQALNGTGLTTVNSKTFDLYVDDVLLDSSIAFTTDLDLGRFGFTTFSSAIGSYFLIDNLETYYAVPESSNTAILAAIAALLVGFVFRRRP